MPDLKQIIRYCKAPNGMPIAWATIGSGSPLVHCSMVNHFEQWCRTKVIGRFLLEIGRGRQLIIYDGPGSGLSDRGFEDLSIENSVSDRAAVVDAASVERFAVYADVRGAQVAISYAASHPDRVERLILNGGAARGMMRRNPTPEEIAQREAMYSAIEASWNAPLPAFRLLFPQQGAPDATHQEQAELAEAFHLAMSGRNWVRFTRAQSMADVSERAMEVRCPTLVLHPRHGTRVPFGEGRRLASLIPGARFVPLESRNVLPVPSDPEFARAAAIREFLQEGDRAGVSIGFAKDLTPRERDVLELLAQGLDNLQIAAHLGMSEKTVRNHITPIFDKLAVENRGQAIVKAREAGMGVGKRPS